MTRQHGTRQDKKACGDVETAAREGGNEAAELTYDVPRLLKSLGCLDRENPERLDLAGVLMFGTKEIQRQLIPAVRVDYLRVPGNEWVQDPERSFISTERRRSLISVLYLAMDTVRSDLLSGFLLTENDIQAKSIGLPDRALREARRGQDGRA